MKAPLMGYLSLTAALCAGCGYMQRDDPDSPQQPATAPTELEERVRSLEIRVEFLESKLNDVEDQIQGEVTTPP